VLALANMLLINGTGQEEPQIDGQVCSATASITPAGRERGWERSIGRAVNTMAYGLTDDIDGQARKSLEVQDSLQPRPAGGIQVGLFSVTLFKTAVDWLRRPLPQSRDVTPP
jgi:hypothetical protein